MAAFHPASLWLEQKREHKVGVPGQGIVLAVLLSAPLWAGIIALGRAALDRFG